jgi:uncharacterized protein (UPF0303 family)
VDASLTVLSTKEANMVRGTEKVSRTGGLRHQAQKFVLPRFDAAAARAIGEITFNLAFRRGLTITVCIARPGQTLYFSAMEGADPDDESRLLKRMRTVFAFGESSLEVGIRLRQSGRSLNDFGFDPAMHSVSGGAIPLCVENGVVKGAAAVVGMSDQANHDLITEAVCWHVGVDFPQFKSARYERRSRPAPARNRESPNTSRF